MIQRLVVSAAALVVASNVLLAWQAISNRAAVDATLSGLELPLVSGDAQNTAFTLRLDGSRAPRQAVSAEQATALGFGRAVTRAIASGARLPRGVMRRRAWAAIERSTAPAGVGWQPIEVVELGPEPGALRARHPDRSRTAVVRAEVGVVYLPVAGSRAPRQVLGVVDLVPSMVAVPRELRHVFEEPVTHQSDELPRFRVTVSFGQRREPWLVAAERLP